MLVHQRVSSVSVHNTSSLDPLQERAGFAAMYMCKTSFKVFSNLSLAGGEFIDRFCTLNSLSLSIYIYICIYIYHTVDGRHPAPVYRWLIPLFIGFSTIQGGEGFLPSTVCICVLCTLWLFIIAMEDLL